MLRARLIVTGLVTGVGFRSYAKNSAKKLGLRGFVRNMKSGKVEIIAEGYEKQLNEFVDILKKGPFHSKVDDIKIDWEDPTNAFKDFSIEV